MGVKRIFGSLWWLFPGYPPKPKHKHTPDALKKRRRIKTYEQQKKELDNKRKELDDRRARLHKQAWEQQAWHCELEAQSQLVIDLLDDVLKHQKQFQQQLHRIESNINARQKSLRHLKQELLNHAAVHTVPEEAACQHCLPERSFTPPM